MRSGEQRTDATCVCATANIHIHWTGNRRRHEKISRDNHIHRPLAFDGFVSFIHIDLPYTHNFGTFYIQINSLKISWASHKKNRLYHSLFFYQKNCVFLTLFVFSQMERKNIEWHTNSGSNNLMQMYFRFEYWRHWANYYYYHYYSLELYTVKITKCNIDFRIRNWLKSIFHKKSIAAVFAVLKL